MHITRDYTGLPNAKDKALDDCREYLGIIRFDNVVRAIRADILNNGIDDIDTSTRSIASCLSMIGIQGFPARAMAEYAVAGVCGQTAV